MKRAVRSVIRLVAAGITVVGAMYIGLDFLRFRLHGDEPSMLHILLGGLMVVAGLALFAASSSLAARLTDEFDE